MNVKKVTLGCIVAFASVVPLRADVILTYRLSSFVPNVPGDVQPADPIPDSDPLGAPITGPLVIPLGSERYIQVCIIGTAPPPMQTQNPQLLWNGSNRMITFAFAFNYPSGVLAQPYVPLQIPFLDDNLSNANAQLPFAVGHPNTFPSYNMGQTAITGVTLLSGIQGTSGVVSERVIATLKVRGATTGTGMITLTDLNLSPTEAGFGLAGGQNLDNFIFAPAHNNFPLAVQVIPAPEPSSMALAGVALAGIGWRKWRQR